MSLYQGLLSLWIRIGIHLFPPVIHPMMVHFPIALLYTSLATTVLGFFWPLPDHFFERVSFWLLVAGFLAGVLTAAMGVISEQFVHWNPTTTALLSSHQRDAVLTGVFCLIALVLRLAARYPRAEARRGWSLAQTGRGKSTVLAGIFLAAAVAMITITASIGGTMVYQYGVGVHGIGFREPAALKTHTKA